MSTLTVMVADEVLRNAQQTAAQQQTTLDALLQRYLERLAGQTAPRDEAGRAQARRELVQALAECKAEVGEKPTRERTYGDRRFH